MNTSYSYIDLHCDTITMLHFPKENLTSKKRMVTLERMEKGNAEIVCFSAFVPTGYIPRACRDAMAWKRFKNIAWKKNELLRIHKDELRPVLSCEDFEPSPNDTRTGLLFTIEDSGVFGSDLSKVQKAYDQGVRIASLTWNHENSLAFPNSAKQSTMSKGLKSFGFEVIAEMNRLGIAIDVSHLSDGGFWDVAAHSQKPFIATHSNCRALTPHPRNLTDEMIRAIAEHGGVIGLNFCPAFLLSPNPKNESRIEDMVRHILHLYKIGGSDVCAIGTDFDGISGKLEVSDPSKMPALFEALEQTSLSTGDLEKLCRENVKRALRDIWE